MELELIAEQGSQPRDDSRRIQSAINNLAAAGGGSLHLRGGLFQSGPILLRSKVYLVIEKDTILYFIPDFDRYGPVWTRWEGVECWAMHPLIFARDSEDLGVRGRGIIDGNGKAWWDFLRQSRKEGRREPKHPFEERLAALNPTYRTQPSGGGGRELQFLRPPLLQFFNCKNVEIFDVHLQNSPFWNTHLVYCEQVHIAGVTFQNPHDGPNTDGLNLDSCSQVHIERCRFDVGDDCLGLKSGSGEDGLRVNRPTEEVLIEHCIMQGGHGGIVIGSETAGGVRNVTIRNCQLDETDRGLRIKTRRGRGGTIENIQLENCTMRGVLCPLVINCYYGPGGPPPEDPVFSCTPQPITVTTPLIRDIRVHGLKGEDCKAAAAFIVGLPERPIENVHIEDCVFTLSENTDHPPSEAAMYRGLPLPAGRGIRLRNIRHLQVKRTTVEFPARTQEQKEPFLIEDNVEDLSIEIETSVPQV
ncbi:MAG: glycoside hydrolase family 28 protein [Treponemataceae bacterium]|nr:glycoside hydrolase family 28 protein [Treponemataceae bacterium]